MGSKPDKAAMARRNQWLVGRQYCVVDRLERRKIRSLTTVLVSGAIVPNLGTAQAPVEREVRFAPSVRAVLLRAVQPDNALYGLSSIWSMD